MLEDLKTMTLRHLFGVYTTTVVLKFVGCWPWNKTSGSAWSFKCTSFLGMTKVFGHTNRMGLVVLLLALK